MGKNGFLGTQAEVTHSLLVTGAMLQRSITGPVQPSFFNVIKTVNFQLLSIQKTLGNPHPNFSMRLLSVCLFVCFVN